MYPLPQTLNARECQKASKSPKSHKIQRFLRSFAISPYNIKNKFNSHNELSPELKKIIRKRNNFTTAWVRERNEQHSEIRNVPTSFTNGTKLSSGNDATIISTNLNGRSASKALHEFEHSNNALSHRQQDEALSHAVNVGDRITSLIPQNPPSYGRKKRQ